MKVLITGADGFIGSHLTEHLVKRGYQVKALSQYNSFNNWGWLEDINCKKDIEIFKNGGWHFNNIMSPEDISLKLKTFAHTEFSSDKFSNIDVIKKKIEKKIDLFERGHSYEKISLDETFPRYLIENLDKYKSFIL